MSGAEVVGLLREIQRLTLDLLEEQDERALEDKQRRLEQLRWRLAAASRRAADGGLGDAA
jgi:hypothetical protein